MAELTNDQRVFLRSQKIALSNLFDATGMSRSSYQTSMDQEGKTFAYGVSPCKSAGHTLRTKAGHCIQCDTKKIAFAKRSSMRGMVYIAGSTAKRLIKVGCGSDCELRLTQINAQRYGDASDWEILAHCTTESAGRIEFAVHEELAEYKVDGFYYSKDGKAQTCYELFRCSYSNAKAVLQATLPPFCKITANSNEDRLIQVYRF